MESLISIETSIAGLIDTRHNIYRFNHTTFDIKNGEQGPHEHKQSRNRIKESKDLREKKERKCLDGKGILSIENIIVGLIDTYTITFTDLTITTFDIKNGEQGPHDTRWAGNPRHQEQDLREIQEKRLDGINGKSAYEIYYENVEYWQNKNLFGVLSNIDIESVLDNINGR